jgi:hypothetical protein
MLERYDDSDTAEIRSILTTQADDRRFADRRLYLN